MSEVNQFDIVFVVDATGSMGAFIASAQRLMVNMIQSLVKNTDVNMEVGVVEYRDHPPQDTTLVRIHQLGSVEHTQKKIAKLAANGGGDGPEAVLDGLYAACKKIEWRKHSRKVAVLIGDAPPHGVGAAGDGFPQGCPCKETIDSVSSMAEQQGITLYAISLNPTAQASFKKLAQLTGGDCFESSAGDSALSKIQGIIKEEFSNLELDRKVLEAWEPESTYDVVAEKISASSNDVLFSYMRLCRRGLIEQEVLVEA